jgi:hypothetical protein
MLGDFLFTYYFRQIVTDGRADCRYVVPYGVHALLKPHATVNVEFYSSRVLLAGDFGLEFTDEFVDACPIGGSINVKTFIKLKFLYMAYGSLRE